MDQPQRLSGKIHVARAEETDRAAVRELARVNHAESAFGRLPFSDQRFDAMFDACMGSPERSILLKASVEGKVVGFLYCNLGPYFIAEGGLIASVMAVYVSKECRSSLMGGKVAVRLVRGIGKLAKAMGADALLFYVTSEIDAAKSDRFFRKMGLSTLGGNYAVWL